jgi:hypothetical protein
MGWERGMTNIIDFKKKKEEKAVARGDSGCFVNSPPDPTEILEPLGEEGKWEAVGIMFAQSEPGEPAMAGWALSAPETRKLAYAMLQAAYKIDGVLPKLPPL